MSFTNFHCNFFLQYRNPNLRLFIGTCGHSYCEHCMNAYFSRAPHPCNECKTNLTLSSFRRQVFEDASVDKEVEIRKKVSKELNLYEEDFSSLREYNDFLEQVEDIVFNLTNSSELIATKSKLDSLKEKYQKTIAKNRYKKFSKDQEEIRKQIQIERETFEELRRKVAMEEMMFNQVRKSNKQNLLKELETSSLPVEAILNKHQKNVNQLLEKEESTKFVDEKIEPAELVVENEICYNYTEVEIMNYGPQVPMMKEKESEVDILNYVVSTTESDEAGGYHKGLACNRALTDAYNCLFY